MSSRAAREERERRDADARFAQERRNTERNAREHLESTIPTQYQHDAGGHGMKMNAPGKVMEAAGSYISALKAEIDSLKAAAATVSPPRPRSAAHAGAVTTGMTPSWVTQIDSVAGIRQVTTRLRQKIEEKVQAEGQLSGKLKELVERAHDVLVDMTDAVEQGNLSADKKRDWARVQEALGRGGFYTQQ